jgi:hypothetical protein
VRDLAPSIVDIADAGRLRDPPRMRRILCGVLLVSGCFQPDGSGGSDGQGGSATSGAQSTGGPSSASSGVDSTTSSATATTVDTTTGGPTTTTLDTPTTDTIGTANNTTDQTCAPACGPCQQCIAGACSPLDAGDPCPADGLQCEGVFGEIDGTCYQALPSAGMCDAGGACVPVCDAPGVAIAKCQSASCLKENHPCQPGAMPGAITVESLCETTNVMTTGCTQTCNQVDDAIEVASCGAGGACEVKTVTECAPWACDPQSLLCKTGPCQSNLDCAAGFQCDVVNGGECKEL